MGFFGVLEFWCYDNERGFVCCCCGVGLEEVGVSYSFVFVRDFEFLDGDVVVFGLDEVCFNCFC